MKYSVVIPAHNEEAFLEVALQSLAKQTLLPVQVVVVNDNSTDKTEQIINDFVGRYPFFTKLNISSSNAHIPGSKVVNAFNQGLELIADDFDFLVKLDADLELPNTYFEKVAYIFKTNPKVGIAGGFAYEEEKDGKWKLNHPMNRDHVRGAFKAYSKECFRAIGGLKPAMGWDTVDELLARFHGFEIFTDDTLHVKHLRPLGKGYSKQARLLQGRAMYGMRYGFILSAIASLKMAWKHGKPGVFIHNLQGYFSAQKQKAPYLVAPDEGVFIREYRWKGIKQKLF